MGVGAANRFYNEPGCDIDLNRSVAKVNELRIAISRQPLRWILPCLLILLNSTAEAYGQNVLQQDPASAMKTMFDRMAESMGPIAPMFGRFSDEQIAQLDAIEVSTNEEAAYGRKVLEGFRKKMKQQGVAVTSRDADLVYIRKLLPPLQSQMTNSQRYRKLQVYLIDTDGQDAFSIPGGHLLITRGLLEGAQNEAALVGVLAHELSHLDRGHQLLPLKQSKLARQPTDFQDSMLMVALVARPFRSEQESEADSDATIWMMAAGYQPNELVRLLIRWDQNQNTKTPWQDFVPGFVKSHPDAGLRAQAVSQIASKHRQRFPKATFVGEENLRQRAPKPQ